MLRFDFDLMFYVAMGVPNIQKTYNCRKNRHMGEFVFGDMGEISHDWVNELLNNYNLNYIVW